MSYQLGVMEMYRLHKLILVCILSLTSLYVMAGSEAGGKSYFSAEQIVGFSKKSTNPWRKRRSCLFGSETR